MSQPNSNNRRILLEEGWSLLNYILKKPPDPSLLKRYVRLVESKYSGTSLNLPKLFINFPILLSLITASACGDKLTWQNFSGRLNSATRIAEASPENVSRFLGNVNHKSLVSIISGLIASILICTFWLAVSAVLAKIVKILINRNMAE